jgi:hypothetical protein
MPFNLLFLVYIVLCIIAFFDVFFTMRKNSLLKFCILLIIFSLFFMNYFSYLDTLNRFQILLAKCMRIVYVCGTMLIIIQRVTPKIPKWIFGIVTFSVIFLVGVRVFYYDRISLVTKSQYASQIFAVGPELNSPVPFARYIAYALVAFVTFLTFYFYRRLFMSVGIDDIINKVVSRWILSMVIPFYLLVIFGILGSLQMYEQSASAYLFSIFSFLVIFSILFRPKILNTACYFQSQSKNTLASS